MDKNTDNFWTDELVKEFALGAIKLQTSLPNDVNLNRGIYHFKKEKSKKEEPQWEILSFQASDDRDFFTKNMDGYWSSSTYCKRYTLQDLMDKMKPIHSVKRFPDNTVWSVDMVTGQGKIASFEIIDGGMYARLSAYSKYHIGLLTEAPKEEQVPIKVESVVFYTSMSEKPIRDVFSVRLTGDISEDKLQPIKKAIQSVINNDGLSEYFNKQPKLYSESELLQARREAFKEARLAWASSIKQPFDGVYKHETVEDYINSLK